MSCMCLGQASTHLSGAAHQQHALHLEDMDQGNKDEEGRKEGRKEGDGYSMAGSSAYIHTYRQTLVHTSSAREVALPKNRWPCSCITRMLFVRSFNTAAAFAVRHLTQPSPG